MKALCVLGRLTVLFAVDPSNTALIGLRLELCTTKKIQARMMPKSSPITKSQLSVSFADHAEVA